MFKVIIMQRAGNDMREIRDYITDEIQNPDAAKRRISLIQSKIESLKENPARFPFVRDSFLASKGFRMMAVKTHNIFYIVREKEKIVSIIRILYERRDWMRMLKTNDTEEKERQ